MVEETRRKLGLIESVEPPMKPYLNPFPPKGSVFDYMFIKEVSIFLLFQSKLLYDL